VLESSDEEHSSQRQPENVTGQFVLSSRIRGARVDLTLYEEGFLAVREKCRGRRSVERLLDLRYLDPRPTISRIVAPRLRHLALSVGSLTGVLGVLAWFGILPAVTLPAALLLGIATGILAWLFFCRTGEQSVFQTANGRAEVLALFCALGSIRALRRVVPVFVDAIRRAQRLDLDDKRLRLRQEIREHYRLARNGIISQDDCAKCTRRILSQFD
jgi:hypothetical protein